MSDINKEWPNNNTRAFKNKPLDELAWLAVDANQDGQAGAKAEISIRHIENMDRNSNVSTFLGWIMIVLTMVILIATLQMADILDIKQIGKYLCSIVKGQ
ncbi:MAG: hypothetical protein MRY79_02805 [Alphaproteobacteria bacterium]|nr:hypothetical protein [Alphaproteobacteria bacterium]